MDRVILLQESVVDEFRLILIEASDQLQGKIVGGILVEFCLCVESGFFDGGQVHFGTDEIVDGGDAVAMRFLLAHKFIHNKGCNRAIEIILISQPMADLRGGDQINIREIPKFEFEINNEELRNCLKEVNFQLKTQDKSIQKIKKDIQVRPTATSIAEALVIINSMVEVDPGLAKLLKTKQKKEDLGENPINSSSADLGRKINSISECATILSNQIKNVEKKIAEQQFTFKSMLNEKSNTLQDQIDELTTNSNNEFLRINEKIELNNSEYGDKLREVETKTLWQINDCKLKLSNCVNEQMVRDAMRQLQSKTVTKIKEEAIRQGSIDPDRIQRIELDINKQEKEFASMITETNFKIQSLKENIDNSLLSKKSFSDERLEIQKRFGLLNNNFGDLHRRIKHAEITLNQEKDKVSKLEAFEEAQTKESHRMNEVLKNMKIGDDFQKMIEKMDPHRICALDETVEGIQLAQQKQTKNLQLARKQIDRIRSKTEFCNIITPNADTSSKLSRDDVGQIINEYFISNQFAKKIHHLQAQFLEVKAFPEMLNEQNKKIARLGKQTDTHNLLYELRGLQEYLKKQILIVNNRINNIEVGINEDKKRRPTSAHRSQVSDGKLSSSISYKKLTPVNCISCYQNPMTSQKKSLIKRY